MDEKRRDDNSKESPDSTMFQVAISWKGMEDVPILLANQFIVQHWEGDFVITAGQLTPPPILGTIEERRDQAKGIMSVPVNVVARLSLNPGRMRELIGALTENLSRYEQRETQGKDE